MARWLGVAAVAAALICSGCGERPEVDQLAQAGMINKPARVVRACLGRPDMARAIDGTQIWAYRVGTVRYDASCNVVVVLTQGRVSQVYYTGPAGDHLGIGERCEFAVQACVDP
jgi:hypothetical protein